MPLGPAPVTLQRQVNDRRSPTCEASLHRPHRLRGRALGIALALTQVAGQVAGQGKAPAEEPLPQVAVAGPGATVQPMRSCSQGLAFDGFGQSWAMVLERTTRPRPGQNLWLHRSADGGSTWQQVVRVPFGWSESAALVGRPDDPLLHVACGGGRPGERFQSALYATFDVRTWTWSEPTCLWPGTGDTDQYFVWDLAAAADGTLLAVVGTRAQPPAPWPGPWSAGAFRLPVGATAWQGPLVLHQTHTATWVQAQWRGEVAEFVFRTRMLAQGQGQDLRFGASRWPAAAAIVGPTGASHDPLDGLRAAAQHTPGSASSFVLDASGGRSILFAGYTTRPNEPHALLLAHAPPDGPWTCTVVADDPNLPRSDVALQHFALVRGPGNHVVTLYSSCTEAHRRLYRRTFEAGQPLEPARVVATSEASGAFAHLVPIRDARFLSRLEAVVGGEREATPLGVRAILRPGPAQGRWLVPTPSAPR